MSRLRDATGRPGPSTWQAGDFPEGHADYPVGGISWYEAEAYCEFSGKSLPTGHQWGRAMGRTELYFIGFGSLLYSLSNFGGRGPSPVGAHSGMTAYGAYDMAGNVREWCWNPTVDGRLMRGGGWDDAEYMYFNLTQQSPWNRAPQNGVRCVSMPDRSTVPEATFDFVDLSPAYDYRDAVPVDDAVFAAYRSRFDYDRTDLGARIEERDESKEDWIREKVTFNAAYEGKTVIAHLFLPRNASPPYQTVVIFPGDGVWGRPPFTVADATWYVDFFVKSGRAAVYPIYMGAHERSAEMNQDDWEPYTYADNVVKWVKDFKRTVDYLETRDEFDHQKTAFYGVSRGGQLGGIVPAVDERIRVNLLYLAGFGGEDRPEVNPVSYVSKITIPTLILNGKLDAGFPLETDVMPFYRLLGTAEEDKRLILYDTDHYIPKREVIKETLAWLDKYFGPPD